MYGLSFKTPQLSLKAKAIHKFLKMFSPWVKENLCKRNTKAVPRDFMNLKKLTSSLLNKCFEVNLISALNKAVLSLFNSEKQGNAEKQQFILTRQCSLPL